ncbi:MAG: efflux RND transporter periplasmic adaptor subunit [Verrucomicrobiae bacterium]|nr:efflux RND transporter periplasmic adaptor subunit [Verrucomicrobiae bacterium]
MKLAAKILFPLLVLGAAGWLTWWLIETKPEPPQRKKPPVFTRVEATKLTPTHFDVVLETRGVVRPRTETTLIPEVSGRIVEIGKNFREGSFFEEGELLLKIDPLNYETAIVIAQSNLAQARTTLAEEKARSEQALENWKRLGKSGDPGDLVLRKPQLAEMEARVAAAEAEVKRAQRDLERTEIRAPYAGRILEQNVDVGQYVSNGTDLARLYAIDYVEVRLPLTNRQLAFIDLPELYRGNFAEAAAKQEKEAPEVLLEAEIGGEKARWEGRVVRVEGAIDERTRQLFVVAQVDNPYQWKDDGSPPLKIGLFTDALVEGRTLENVFVLPRAAVRAGEEVIVINADNRIQRRQVNPIWSDREHVVIPADEAGLKTGETVCLTPLAYPADGARVLPTIDGVAPPMETPGKRPGGGPPGGGKPAEERQDTTSNAPAPPAATAEKPTEQG